MIKCDECGKEVDFGVYKCPYCGNQLMDDESPKEKSGNKLGLVACAAVFAIILFGFLMLDNKMTDDAIDDFNKKSDLEEIQQYGDTIENMTDDTQKLYLEILYSQLEQLEELEDKGIDVSERKAEVLQEIIEMQEEQ